MLSLTQSGYGTPSSSRLTNLPSTSRTPPTGTPSQKGSSLNPNGKSKAATPSGPVLLGPDLAPVLPLSPICAPRYQALHTTYPSRMRCGTSSLMQPNALSASGTGGFGGSNGSHALANASASSSSAGAGAGGGIVSGKRVRTQLNYADLADAGVDQDDDVQVEEAKKARGNVVWGDGRSYLGVLPPGNLVQVQPARLTNHARL